jgi:hypothetical protein
LMRSWVTAAAVLLIALASVSSNARVKARPPRRPRLRQTLRRGRLTQVISRKGGVCSSRRATARRVTAGAATATRPTTRCRTARTSARRRFLAPASS